MNQQSELLEANAQALKDAYQSERGRLTPEEQRTFDKVIEVMTSLSAFKSSRIRALDAVLTLGMSAVTLHPMALDILILGSLDVLAKAITFHQTFKQDPRFNQ